jgi:hypothetical protein
VSVLVAARSIGFAVKVQERVVLATVAAYRERMAEYARMRNLDVWQAYVDIFLGRLCVAKALGRRLPRRLRPPAARLEGLRGRRGDEPPRADRLRAALRGDPGARPRPLRDRIAISAYLGRSDAFDDAVLSFAEAYAEQNDRDYAALRRAVAAGEIVARSDV